MKTLITPLLGLFMFLSSFSTVATEQCNNITAVYSNGMKTENYTNNGALEQFIRLQSFVKEYPELNKLNFKYVYNPTEGKYEDFRDEVVGQLKFNNIVAEWRNNSSNTESIGSLEESIHYQGLDLDWEAYNNNPALLNTATKYLEYLHKGHCVIAVGYSQGNWVANWAYDFVVSQRPDYKDRIKVIGIGTPANRVAGHESLDEQSHFYVSINNDEIVDWARDASPVLDGNVSISNPIGTVANLDHNMHSLAFVYLAAPETRNAISNAFKCVAMIFSDYPASDGESSASCKPFATINDDSIDGGTLTIAADSDTVVLSGVVTSLSSSKVDDLLVMFNDEQVGSAGSNNISFTNETGEFTLTLTGIPTGNNNVSITPLDSDRNAIEVSPISIADAVDGLLSTDDSTSFFLNVVREGEQASCNAYAPTKDDITLNVIDSNLPYAYGFPINLKGDFEINITFQLKGVLEQYKHCIDSMGDFHNMVYVRFVDRENLIFETQILVKNGVHKSIQVGAVNWLDNDGNIKYISAKFVEDQSSVGYPMIFTDDRLFADIKMIGKPSDYPTNILAGYTGRLYHAGGFRYGLPKNSLNNAFVHEYISGKVVAEHHYVWETKLDLYNRDYVKIYKRIVVNGALNGSYTEYGGGDVNVIINGLNVIYPYIYSYNSDNEKTLIGRDITNVMGTY